MHVVGPLLDIMSSSHDVDQRRFEEMEAKAVDRAKASADAAFRPSPSILNAQSAAVLLQQVDGPSLKTYEGTESVYVGRAVPLAAGSKLNIPINVSTPGSVVEYAVELMAYDVEFSITAEREEGITIVKVRISKLSLLNGFGDNHFCSRRQRLCRRKVLPLCRS